MKNKERKKAVPLVSSFADNCHVYLSSFAFSRSLFNLFINFMNLLFHNHTSHLFWGLWINNVFGNPMGSQERGSMGAPSFTFFRIKSWACNAMHPGLASFASDSRNFYVKMGLVFNFLRFFFFVKLIVLTTH